MTQHHQICLGFQGAISEVPEGHAARLVELGLVHETRREGGFVRYEAKEVSCPQSTIEWAIRMLALGSRTKIVRRIDLTEAEDEALQIVVRNHDINNLDANEATYDLVAFERL